MKALSTLSSSLLIFGAAAVEADGKKVANREPQESDCLACPNGYEYYFSTNELDWYDHLNLAPELGCQLAMIESQEQQAAAVRAMEPYIGYQYMVTDDMHGSFAYIGGTILTFVSDPANGRYTFSWWDEGDNIFSEVNRGDNSNVKTIGLRIDESTNFIGVPYVRNETGYANFIPSEPNWSDDNFWGGQMALSLDENGSKGIPRGSWLDVDGRKTGPALYKCCVSDFPACTV